MLRCDDAGALCARTGGLVELLAVEILVRPLALAPARFAVVLAAAIADAVFRRALPILGRDGTLARAVAAEMPVATIIEEVAESISPALVKASRLHASGSHIAAYPRDSSSEAISPLSLAGRVSWANVHTPMVPRSTSGVPIGRWNWLMPILTHMLREVVLRNGSRV